MKQLGLGIIGLGLIAEVHAQVIQEIEGCRLVAGLDTSRERALDFEKKYHCTAYTDMQEFLADPALDIVIIATPSGLHLEGALAAAQAKKHLIIEKPLEITTERCNQIIDACSENGVKLTCVFPTRYHKTPRLIKTAVEQGRFGTIVMASVEVKWFRSQEYYDNGAWRGTWKFDGGGALMNQSIHAIDLMQWILGQDVSQVFSFTDTLSHERIEVEDTAVAVLKFANGALGTIEGTTSAYPGFLKKIAIMGSKGSVVLEEENIISWEFDEAKPEDEDIRNAYKNCTESGGGAADPASIGHHGHYTLVKSFVDSVRNNTPVDITGESSRDTVSIIESIYKSAQTGKAVRINS